MANDDTGAILLRQAGEIMALRMVLAQLIARLGNQYGDTAHYVLTLTESLRTTADAALDDPDTPDALADGMMALADYIESMALD